MTNYKIKELNESDIPSIVDIYNRYVKINTAAFSDEKIEKSEFAGIVNYNLPNFIIKKDLGIIGFGLTYQFRKEKTFSKSVKFSYFILPEHTGNGLGSKLYELMERKNKEIGIENILVNISSENNGSIAFHKKKDFKECGRFEKVGEKFGRKFDLIWMSKKI